MRLRTGTFLLSCVLLLAAPLAQAAMDDPWIGTWKLNLAKSKYDPMNLAPKSATTLKREAAGMGFKTIIDGATHTETTADTLDGKDYPITGSPDFNSSAYKRIDASTLVTVNKKDGAVVRMGRSIMAKDGKSWTVEQIGYNSQGIAFHNAIVFERQ